MAAEFEAYSDEQLVRESQAGSLPAFEELVYRYERRIYGFVAQFCRNREDASEVTQETFVKAFQALGQFDAGHAFAAWLFTIARRKCIDHHRASPPESEGDMPELVDVADPAEILADREDSRSLWQLARRALSETQFDALWLRYVEDLSIAEIAQVFRKTQTYVKVLLFRARSALGRELGAERSPKSDQSPKSKVQSPKSLQELRRQGPGVGGRTSEVRAQKSGVGDLRSGGKSQVHIPRFTFHASRP
jgi:RNA polymerase sigma-70 factor (ECF subfamily)